MAKAIRYALSRWKALIRYVGDGRLEMTNNAAERAMLILVLGRKNYLFCGSDAGGQRAACLYTITATAKLNGLNPEAYLADVLGRIADHPINKIEPCSPGSGQSSPHQVSPPAPKPRPSAHAYLGWPIAARGGDWDATALNLAVFRGDKDLAAFLLVHGASWREEHGYGSDVLGTLSWVSVNEPTGVDDPDWSGCARALMAHGLPSAERDPSDPDKVLIVGRFFPFSEDVTEVLTAGSTSPEAG